MKIYIGIFWLLLCSCTYQNVSLPKIDVFEVDNHSSYVVAIDIVTESEEAFGATGILIDEWHVVANYHILEEDTSEIWVGWTESLQRDMIMAEVVFSDKENDLLLLKLEQNVRYETADITNKDPVFLGEDIIVLGFPEATQVNDISILHAFQGTVAAQQPKSRGDFARIILDAKILQGNSGGPVIDRNNGRIIGLISGTIVDIIDNDDGSSIEGESVGVAIPMQSIQRFVKNYRDVSAN